MAHHKLRAVIFDIGRVLIRIDVKRAMGGLAAGLSLSPEELWGAIENDPRWPDWQEGRITPRDWHLHLSRRLGTTLTFERFTQIWNLVLDPQPLQENALFEKLSKTYRLALLSNTDPIHVAHMEATYDFFRFFPARTYSCAVGASKPSPLVYLEALRSVKVQASEAVYIDDIAAYVEAARSLGLAGIHYHSRAALVDSLRALGVDLPLLSTLPE
jgi:HAD superfamily hydrolase (TIGR01509 family)